MAEQAIEPTLARDSFHCFGCGRLPVFRGSLSSANTQHDSVNERNHVPVWDAGLPHCTWHVATGDWIRVEFVLERFTPASFGTLAREACSGTPGTLHSGFRSEFARS